MEVTVEEQRAFIKIMTLRYKKPTEIHKELVEACGEAAMALRIVQKWSKRVEDRESSTPWQRLSTPCHNHAGDTETIDFETLPHPPTVPTSARPILTCLASSRSHFEANDSEIWMTWRTLHTKFWGHLIGTTPWTEFKGFHIVGNVWFKTKVIILKDIDACSFFELK